MSENNDPDVKPAKLPPMTHDEVKARAQRILDHRRSPIPYDASAFNGELTEDERAVLGEFVMYWMPYLTVKERK